MAQARRMTAIGIVDAALSPGRDSRALRILSTLRDGGMRVQVCFSDSPEPRDLAVAEREPAGAGPAPGPSHAPGSFAVGRGRRISEVLDALSDSRADILYSFDDFSLEVCTRLQAHYWSQGHRCLWFHDVLRGLPIEDVDIDNFQVKRRDRLGSALRQTDRVSTFSAAAAARLHTDFNLADVPVILPDLPRSRPPGPGRGQRPTSSGRVVLFAGTDARLAADIAQAAGREATLLVRSEDPLIRSELESAFEEVRSDGRRLARLSFSPDTMPDSVVVAPLPAFEAQSLDYDLSSWLAGGATVFLPQSYDTALDGAVEEIRIRRYDPAATIRGLRLVLDDATPEGAPSRMLPPEWDDLAVDRISAMVADLAWRLEDRPPVQRDAALTDLRVLHGLTGAAGQPWMLSRAQRAAGIKADTFCADGNKFAYRSDKAVLTVDFDRLSAFIKTHASKYDVFQFYFRSYYFNKITLSFPTALDLLALKAAGKRIIFYFMGSEIRFHSLYKSFSPFNYVDEKPSNVINFPEETQRRLFSIFTSIADAWAVSDAEMESYVPGTPIIERAIDMEAWPLQPPTGNSRPLVVHAPSRQAVKGSAHVFDAVDALREKGLEFDFQLIENLPQDEAREIYKRADIVVDQLRIGWYGFLSVEAMAMGKAVVCYIRDDLLDNFGPDGPPLAVADPETVEDVLERLILNPALRERVGARGRAFVETVHRKEVVARKFNALYEQAVANPRPVDVKAVAEFLVHQADYANREHARLKAKAGEVGK